MIKIAVVGDVMPGGLLHYKKDPFIKKDVLEYLSTFNLRVGTLECALGDDLEPYRSLLTGASRDKNIIYAKNNSIERVKTLGLDLVTIANNHIFDLGAEGLRNTISILKENNIMYCGAGLNLEEASKPAVINIEGKDLAFIGCSEVFASSPVPAAINQPGYNPLHIVSLIEEIKSAKKKYEYVFILVHWGNEYTYFPTNENKKIGFKLIEAGADGVFGGHSHAIQPAIYYKSKPIVFSLGNFLFPDRFVQPPAPTFYPDNPKDYANVPVSTSPRCSEITLKVWRKESSYTGMIADITVSGKIKIKRRITKLSKTNTVQFSSICYRLKFKLMIISFMLKTCYSCFQHIKNIYHSLKINFKNKE